MIKPHDLQNTMVTPDTLAPEFPPNQVGGWHLRCVVFGHDRQWEASHPGSRWEVHRCQRCGDTRGGTRQREGR